MHPHLQLATAYCHKSVHSVDAMMQHKTAQHESNYPHLLLQARATLPLQKPHLRLCLDLMCSIRQLGTCLSLLTAAQKATIGRTKEANATQQGKAGRRTTPLVCKNSKSGDMHVSLSKASSLPEGSKVSWLIVYITSAGTHAWDDCCGHLDVRINKATKEGALATI